MALDPSNAVVHLSMRRGEHELSVGTGILYSRNGKVFIVTAWHNLSGRHAITMKPISSVLAFPDTVVATVSCRTDLNGKTYGYSRLPFTIPLEVNDTPTYLVHAQAFPRVDVAAIPFDVGIPYQIEMQVSNGGVAKMTWLPRGPISANGMTSDVECIQDVESSYAQPQSFPDLWLGDDLFIMGYPRALSDLFGQPLWKRATVASSPQSGTRVKHFLVDCASREGMSGAPVVSYNRTGLTMNGGAIQVGTPTTIFHGIYTSRVGKADLFEAQIGTVWQRTAADEIIDAGVPASPSESLEAYASEIEAVIEQSWHTDAGFAEKMVEWEAPREYFLQSVMEALHGRADPSDVRERILDAARRKLGALSAKQAS
ncbi:hypothetical protein [Paraburkholderia solisilvae]|uniref:Serine protease n=1 Tax=Paraburkholderia solisilvae TaxID=624376 RepID=A0A6J5E2R0_9BURK|nr:hypothetical protein [Paraburkholderia solisilvae]CAB3759375.1 hypothetical protein LMG29739_03137 [Paraburkholderia solisilvae]